METHQAINFSDNSAAAIYIVPKVQVFPKQLKELPKLQYVKTQKRLLIDSIPYLSIQI